MTTARPLATALYSKRARGLAPASYTTTRDMTKHGVCESSNYRRGFFQVDTKDYESWTQNLND